MDKYTIGVTYVVCWGEGWKDDNTYLMDIWLTDVQAEKLLQVLLENREKWPDGEPGELDLRKTDLKDTDPELFRFLEARYLDCWRIAAGACMIRYGKNYDTEAMDWNAALAYAVEHLGFRTESLDDIDGDDYDFYDLEEEEYEEFEEFFDDFLASMDDRELVNLNEEYIFVDYTLDEDEFLAIPIVAPMQICEKARKAPC